jgi:hypothetical protein
LSPLHDDLVYTVFGSAGAIIGLAILVALAAASIYGLARPNRWSFAAALALGPLIPTLNLLLPLWTKMADRLFYLPMLGVGAAASFLADGALGFAESRPAFRRAVAGGMAAIVVLLAWGTWREAPRYRNSWALYSSIFERQPGSQLGQFYFAQELLFAGRAAEAERLLRPLYDEHPESLKIAKYVGRATLEQGRAQEAIDALEGRQFTGRDGVEALLTLQQAYLKVGRCEEVEAIARGAADSPALDARQREAFLANARLAQQRRE